MSRLTALYEDLKLEEGCSDEDIRASYKRLALLHHPDKGGDPEEFKKISAAYEVLSDPEKRRKFNESTCTCCHHHRHYYGSDEDEDYEDASEIFARAFFFSFAGGRFPFFASDFYDVVHESARRARAQREKEEEEKQKKKEERDKSYRQLASDLKSTNVASRRSAFESVVALANAEYAVSLIFSYGMLPAIVAGLEDADSECKHFAAFAISLLAKRRHHAGNLMSAGVIPAVVKALSSSSSATADADLVLPLTNIIIFLATDDDVLAKFGEKDLFGQVLKLVQHSNKVVRSNAIRLLSTFSRIPNFGARILTLGAAPVLLRSCLPAGEPVEAVNRLACDALAALLSNQRSLKIAGGGACLSIPPLPTARDTVNSLFEAISSHDDRSVRATFLRIVERLSTVTPPFRDQPLFFEIPLAASPDEPSGNTFLKAVLELARSPGRAQEDAMKLVEVWVKQLPFVARLESTGFAEVLMKQLLTSDDCGVLSSIVRSIALMAKSESFALKFAEPEPLKQLVTLGFSCLPQPPPPPQPTAAGSAAPASTASDWSLPKWATDRHTAAVSAPRAVRATMALAESVVGCLGVFAEHKALIPKLVKSGGFELYVFSTFHSSSVEMKRSCAFLLSHLVLDNSVNDKLNTVETSVARISGSLKTTDLLTFQSTANALSTLTRGGKKVANLFLQQGAAVPLFSALSHLFKHKDAAKQAKATAAAATQTFLKAEDHLPLVRSIADCLANLFKVNPEGLATAVGRYTELARTAIELLRLVVGGPAAGDERLLRNAVDFANVAARSQSVHSLVELDKCELLLSVLSLSKDTATLKSALEALIKCVDHGCSATTKLIHTSLLSAAVPTARACVRALGTQKDTALLSLCCRFLRGVLGIDVTQPIKAKPPVTAGALCPQFGPFMECFIDEGGYKAMCDLVQAQLSDRDRDHTLQAEVAGVFCCLLMERNELFHAAHETVDAEGGSPGPSLVSRLLDSFANMTDKGLAVEQRICDILLDISSNGHFLPLLVQPQMLRVFTSLLKSKDSEVVADTCHALVQLSDIQEEGSLILDVFLDTKFVQSIVAVLKSTRVPSCQSSICSFLANLFSQEPRAVKYANAGALELVVRLIKSREEDVTISAARALLSCAPWGPIRTRMVELKVGEALSAVDVDVVFASELHDRDEFVEVRADILELLSFAGAKSGEGAKKAAKQPEPKKPKSTPTPTPTPPPPTETKKESKSKKKQERREQPEKPADVPKSTPSERGSDADEDHGKPTTTNTIYDVISRISEMEQIAPPPTAKGNKEGVQKGSKKEAPKPHPTPSPKQEKEKEKPKESAKEKKKEKAKEKETETEKRPKEGAARVAAEHAPAETEVDVESFDADFMRQQQEIWAQIQKQRQKPIAPEKKDKKPPTVEAPRHLSQLPPKPPQAPPPSLTSPAPPSEKPPSPSPRQDTRASQPPPASSVLSSPPPTIATSTEQTQEAKKTVSSPVGAEGAVRAAVIPVALQPVESHSPPTIIQASAPTRPSTTTPAIAEPMQPPPVPPPSAVQTVMQPLTLSSKPPPYRPPTKYQPFGLSPSLGGPSQPAQQTVPTAATTFSSGNTPGAVELPLATLHGASTLQVPPSVPVIPPATTPLIAVDPNSGNLFAFYPTTFANATTPSAPPAARSALERRRAEVQAALQNERQKKEALQVELINSSQNPLEFWSTGAMAKRKELSTLNQTCDSNLQSLSLQLAEIEASLQVASLPMSHLAGVQQLPSHSASVFQTDFSGHPAQVQQGLPTTPFSSYTMFPSSGASFSPFGQW